MLSSDAASCMLCGLSWQGKDELPFPARDFWAFANLSQPAAWTKAESRDKNSNYLSVFDPSGIDEMPLDPPIFHACFAGQCLGGVNFSCAPGYTGTQCFECKVGQFYWQGQCGTSCDDIAPKGVVTFFGIMAVVSVWVIINKSAGGMYAGAFLSVPRPLGSGCGCLLCAP